MIGDSFKQIRSATREMKIVYIKIALQTVQMVIFMIGIMLTE